MSRSQQDTFIDEEEESCPLCVEEFDVQDRNFKPCPCGYQICQFCFNNIRNNLNGLCPACRREYREETIEYKVITAEELKAEDNKKKRLANEKRKHEAQKREIEALNRKHLSGLRVIQRNLVYVTGLNPRIREDELLATLRGEQYFGQYGKILKIVVNKRTAHGGVGQVSNNHHDSQGLGVYVTFSNKSEAERCIAAVDGSQNGDRTLRATYGTTKYCSAYLRNETCPNKNCMFLHEPGEEAESFSRMELSTANSRQNNHKSEYSYGHQPSRPPPRDHHPPNPHLDNVNPMARTSSVAGSASADNDGSSALPSTANWAKNPPTPASRPASLVHSLAKNQPSKTPSPQDMPASPLSQKVQTARNQENGKKAPDRTKPSVPSPTSSTPASDTAGKNVGVIGQPVPSAAKSESAAPPPAAAPAVPKPKPAQPPLPANLAEQHARMQRMLKALTDPRYCFVLDKEAFGGEFENLCNVPPMFDKHGGKRRRELQEKSKKQQQLDEAGNEEASEAGQPQQTPIGSIGAPPMGPLRGLTPLQQQQQREMLKDVSGQQQNIQGLAALQQESLLAQQQSALRAQTPQGLHQQAGGQQGFGAFSNAQAPMAPAGGHPSGHTRQSSRYTFTNENPMNASTAVNARGNAAHMAEQLRMMPQQQPLPSHQQLAQMYGGAPGLGGSLLGGVQQPPPGLKNAPTPPAPGLGGIPMGNMPGLGQFSGMGLGAHHNKNESELLRLFSGEGASRMGGGATNPSLMRGGDGKLDLGDPSILQARVAQPQHQLQHQQGIQAGGHGQQAPAVSDTGFGPLVPTGPAATRNKTSTTPAPPPPAPSPSIGVSDEDFPALAPAPAPAVAAAPPPPKAAPVKPVATSKKEKKKAVAAASAKKDEVVAEEKKSDPEPVEKQKTVDTAPAAPKVKEESSSKRQGPLMMRILSKDSSASSSALPTPTATAKAESVLQFSDTASIGTSESRPVSPPPASETAQKKKKEQPLMGPALADVPLVVTKTKSAIKKEKQDQRKKEIEAAELAAARIAEVQAPIQGRAKKAKKSGKKPSSSTSSAPATQQQQQQQQQQHPENNNTNEDTASSRPESLIDEQQQQQQQQPPEPKTAAQLIAELGLDLRDYEMLKPNVVGLKWEHHISAEDVAKIRASLPPPGSSPESPQFHVLPGSDPSSVHLSLRGGGSFETRMLVTPAGSVLRGLTPQQEKRYLEMEERRRHEKSWERWGGAEYPIEKTADWKAATMAAGLAAAGSVARHMHLGGDDAQRLSTKEALDYLWNTVMPALPGYAQEHLEGLAKSMEAGGCRVSVGFEDAAVPTDSSDSSSPPQHHAEDALVTVDVKVENPAAPTTTTTTTPSQYGVLELEKMVMAARKETEALEKKCEKLVKRNRKIVGLV